MPVTSATALATTDTLKTSTMTAITAANLTSTTLLGHAYTITDASTALANAIDGSALTGVSSQKADGCVTENALTISNNYTMTTNKSGLSAGDITVANGVTVTIPSGSRYVIV